MPIKPIAEIIALFFIDNDLKYRITGCFLIASAKDIVVAVLLLICKVFTIRLKC